MKLKEFIEGMEIISRYYKRGNHYNLGAEHDVIYLYPTDSLISRPDVEKLHKLGWLQDGCDPSKGEYHPGESWQARV